MQGTEQKWEEKQMTKNTVYEIVTNRIIEKIQDAIDNGTCLPWQQPWIQETHLSTIRH